MAFLSRVGNILRQTASKQIASESSLSRPSIYQALRCMSGSKLFVGGISYATDDTSLREAFSKYGEVAEARVITDRETGRSRGFGFITYTDSEAASSAIQAMDGQELHGRRVRVNFANDRARGGGGYGGGGYGGGGGGYGGGSYGGGGGGYGGGGYGGSGGYNSNYGGGGYNSNYGGGGNSFDSGSTGSYGNQPSYGVTAGGGSNNAAGSGGFNLDGQDWAPSTGSGDNGFESKNTGAEADADNDSSEDTDEKYDQDGTFGRK